MVVDLVKWILDECDSSVFDGNNNRKLALLDAREYDDMINDLNDKIETLEYYVYDYEGHILDIIEANIRKYLPDIDDDLFDLITGETGREVLQHLEKGVS